MQRRLQVLLKFVEMVRDGGWLVLVTDNVNMEQTYTHTLSYSLSDS